MEAPLSAYQQPPKSDCCVHWQYYDGQTLSQSLVPAVVLATERKGVCGWHALIPEERGQIALHDRLCRHPQSWLCT
jgi:hypothetical protein